MAGHGHTHDGIDWSARIEHMRRADVLEIDTNRSVANRLTGLIAPGSTVLDVGSGSGGMSAQLGISLFERGGGTLVLVDAVPELLAAAAEAVRLSVPAGSVELVEVLADLADEDLPSQVPAANLVWAQGVVHHLPDQQAGIDGLVRLLSPGGWFALSEGGLATRCLPWDLGVGEPGLQDRVIAGRDSWFARMRASMEGSVRLPIGWSAALSAAGLDDVTAFSFIEDHPAPAAQNVRDSVADWLTFMGEIGADYLGEDDRAVVARLTDPADDAYVGARDDVFILGATTVQLGRKPETA